MGIPIGVTGLVRRVCRCSAAVTAELIISLWPASHALLLLLLFSPARAVRGSARLLGRGLSERGRRAGPVHSYHAKGTKYASYVLIPVRCAVRGSARCVPASLWGGSGWFAVAVARALKSSVPATPRHATTALRHGLYRCNE